MKETGTIVKKYIAFQLEDEEYAVPVEQIGSIEKILPITRVPRVANFIKGVINLRGVVTPVIDLRVRFGKRGAEFSEHSRIIIVYYDDLEVGLIVDEANDVVDVPQHLIEPAPEVISAADVDFIDGVVKLDNRLLILLNLEKTLSKEEMKELKTMKG